MIGPARPGMERQLRELWQACFHEPARPVNFYLRTLYRPENCLVYSYGDRLASMVHLLPCRVQLAGGETAEAHYIYAAATSPSFGGVDLSLRCWPALRCAVWSGDSPIQRFCLRMMA